MKFSSKIQPGRQTLDTVCRAGFRAVEFWTSAELLSRAADVTGAAREFELDYVIHFPNGGRMSPELLRNTVGMYNDLGCQAMVMHEPMHQRYAEELQRLDSSLRLAVENLKLTQPQFDAWAEQQQWLTLDVEHLWKFTLDDAPLPKLLEKLEAFLARHVDKLAHVHMPGYLPGYAEHRPMYCSREMALAVLSLLADAGYGGFVVSEVDTEYQTERELQMDVLLFERWRQMRASGYAASEPKQPG